MKQKVLNGIDRIETVDFVLKGQRLGLITNPSGVRKNLTPTYRYLYEHYKLTALFAPEHGILGNTEAGGAVDHMTETETGLPVYSLYGKIKAPDAKMFSQIDVLCFDIQDVGARFYTYLYTMTRSMAAAAAAGKPFVVFDRINPVSLSAVEGEILVESYASFVGEYAVPVRYGMTVGEFARYINETRKIGAELYIAPCQGLTRKLYFDDTDLLFIPPSPNIPTVQTALAYLGTCFFESVENISEGR